ncbi:MFS transporter [Streptomyces cocklensis]|uniref:Predicted arabinose efflux permease, MFS family n=1 Tax=Actinacidiphila cocklensis TaxID=887465 RepID=A0A9W4GSI9_9ACTN|nr:MFS transporter [Actinacidiphila cocklensis]MDD1063239.1 MFS transporter [Actinacidiphila cocklensis]CAG6393675.1 Predicted arabinose efflux permease, MFS family [Actinacidiphila cocklensis]
MPKILPRPGPPRVLAQAQLANSIGDGAFYATSALFFTQIVGLSATRVGVALTVGWCTGMLAGVPLGALADRWGPRRTARVLAIYTSATLLAFLVIRSFPLFVLMFCLYACCQGGLTSARQTLLAGLVDADERTRVRAQLQSTLNGGLALGAGVGGVALSVDTESAYLTVFAVDALMFLTAALVLGRLPEVPPAAAPAAGEPRLTVLRDRPYTLLTFLNAILYLNMPLLSLGLPLWIAERTDAPKPMAAAVLVVNMLSVVAFQVRVARQVTSLPTASRTTAKAGLLLFAACLVYAVTGTSLGAFWAVCVLLAGAFVQVFGEMMQGAGAWEIGFGLAPDGKQGQYQGFFGMAPQIARMLGPTVMTTLLIGWGSGGWLVLGGLFLGSGLAVHLVVARYTDGSAAAAEKKPSDPPVEAPAAP